MCCVLQVDGAVLPPRTLTEIYIYCDCFLQQTFYLIDSSYQSMVYINFCRIVSFSLIACLYLPPLEIILFSLSHMVTVA